MNDKPKDSKVLRPAKTGSLSRRDAVNAVKSAITKQKSNIKSGKNSWYKQYIEICPLCGGENKQRIRQTGKKPTDPDKIYFIEVVYDHCMDYSMYGL